MSAKDQALLRNRNRRNAAIFLAGLAIIGLALSTLDGIIGEGWKPFVLAFSVGSASFGVLLNSFSLSEDIERTADSIEGEVRTVSRLIEKRGDFHYRGTDGEAWKMISKRLRDDKAIRVRNTYLPLGQQLRRPLQDAERVDTICAFVERNGTQYSEIVGRDAYLSLRPDQLDRVRYTKSKNAEIFVTNRVFPEANFIIIEFEEAPAEVWFGWGGLLSNETGHVFSTTDRNAVEYFAALFDTLRISSGRLNDKHSIIARLIRYRGFWLDLAFQTPIGSGEDFRPKLANVAIIRFFIEAPSPSRGKDSRLAVQGLAFNFIGHAEVEIDPKSGETLPPKRFEDFAERFFWSNSCEMRKQKIFVSHQAQHPHRPEEYDSTSGHSLYDFEFIDNIGLMKGKVFAPYVREAGNEYKLDIIAKKVEGELAERLEKAWQDNSQEMLRLSEVSGLEQEIEAFYQKLVIENPQMKIEHLEADELD